MSPVYPPSEKKALKAGIVTGLVFVGVVAIPVAILLGWRDNRVDAVLEGSRRGDIVRVGTDVCEVLRARGFIEASVECGYRQTVEVKLIDLPR